MQKIDGVSYQHSRLLFELCHEDIFENLLLYICVKRTNWIIHQIYGSL